MNSNSKTKMPSSTCNPESMSTKQLKQTLEEKGYRGMNNITEKTHLIELVKRALSSSEVRGVQNLQDNDVEDVKNMTVKELSEFLKTYDKTGDTYDQLMAVMDNAIKIKKSTKRETRSNNSRDARGVREGRGAYGWSSQATSVENTPHKSKYATWNSSGPNSLKYSSNQPDPSRCYQWDFDDTSKKGDDDPPGAQQHKCLECKKNILDGAFVPCGHVIFCFQCAVNVKRCPCCLENVQRWLKIYPV